MSESKQLIESLEPSGVVAEFIGDNNLWTRERARNIGVSTRFVISRALLHLPGYSEEDIQSNTPEVSEEIGVKIATLGGTFKSTYDALRIQTELSRLSLDARLKVKDQLYAKDGIVTVPVAFGEVEPTTAQTIQNRLHYIGSARDDSVLDCGLYLGGAETPYAYTSFSVSKRGYQLASLNRATNLSLEPEEVFVMTRSFAFDGAPANSMSKLFHLAHDRIRQQFPKCRVIVTALNPYLKFKGSVFMGSRYNSYALAPMEYWYDNNGFYVPRSKGKYLQQMETPPIVWLARGLDAETIDAIEGLKVDSIVNVTEEEYRNGKPILVKK